MKDELLRTYKKYVKDPNNDISGMLAFSKVIQQCYDANLLGQITDDSNAVNNIVSANQGIMQDAANKILATYAATNIQTALDRVYSQTLEDYKATLTAYKQIQIEFQKAQDSYKKKNWLKPLFISVIASLIASLICLNIDNGIIKREKIREYERKIEVLETEIQDLKDSQSTFYNQQNKYMEEEFSHHSRMYVYTKK